MESQNPNLATVRRMIKYSVIGVIAIIALSFSGKIFESVDSREYHVKQAAVSGTMSVHGDPGWYFQNFGGITKYPRTINFYFSQEELDGDGNEADALLCTFMGNSTAKISGVIRVLLPENPTQRLQLHRDYGSVESVKMDLLRNSIASALKQTGPLFRPEEAFTTRRPEFTRLVNDILSKGIFETETIVDTLSEGGNTIKLTRSILKLDTAGHPIISNRSNLEKYGITVAQIDIKDFDFDPETKKLIEQKKIAEQMIVAAKAAAEKAKQDAITTEEDGKARVAKAEADALVEKKTAVVNAEREAEVAAQLKIKAIEEGAAVLARGKAEAEANKLKVAAGLTPLERATIEKETRIGVAAELAKVQFPANMVIAGGGSGGGVNPFEAVGLESFYNLSKKMGGASN